MADYTTSIAEVKADLRHGITTLSDEMRRYGALVSVEVLPGMGWIAATAKIERLMAAHTKLEAVYIAALAVRKLTDTHEECSCKLCVSSWRKFWRMVDAVEGDDG